MVAPLSQQRSPEHLLCLFLLQRTQMSPSYLPCGSTQWEMSRHIDTDTTDMSLSFEWAGCSLLSVCRNRVSNQEHANYKLCFQQSKQWSIKENKVSQFSEEMFPPKCLKDCDLSPCFLFAPILVNDTEEVGPLQTVDISKPDTTKWILRDLEPVSRYKFYLRSCTTVGCGPVSTEECTTTLETSKWKSCVYI